MAISESNSLTKNPNQQAHILVVDDEPDIRNILKDILQDEGYNVHLAENAEQARLQFKETSPDLVLLDIWMPNEDGISVLQNWVKTDQLNNTPVIMISGHGTVENAVEAVKLGAYDFLEKPLSTGKLLLCIERGLEAGLLRSENQRLKSRLKTESPMISNSDSSKELMRHVQILGPTDSWVFITGESGTGKHLVAKEIHYNSNRAEQNFVELNLAAMPSETVLQQLFGTEADGKVVLGSFEKAKGGTLFINEVLGLNLDTQNKLLSALQEQQFLRIGGNDYIELDVRVIVTTSGNAQEAVSDGLFLEDLYYRLNVIPIEDCDGNFGIRFQGAFLDLPGGGASDALISYAVAAPGPLLTGAHLFANTTVSGSGLVQISETFLPPFTDVSLNVFDNGTVQQLADSVKFNTSADYTGPVSVLPVQKDILLLADETGGIAGTLSFVDQVYHQVPEPTAISLFLIGMVAIIRRRK